MVLKFSAVALIIFLGVPYALGFPLPYEIVVESEEDIYRYLEEGFFEGYDSEELVSLYRFKTEINTADYSELMNLPYMRSAWAKAVVKARKERVITSQEQLMDITGMSRRDLMLISPFITTRWASVVRSVTIIESDGEDSEARQTFRIPGYQGGVRLQGSRRTVCLLEGESAFYEDEKYSVKLEDWYLRGDAGILEITAGNYRVSFDQGLGVSGGSIRSAPGIFPDLSSAEHFYGAAAEGRTGLFSAALFVSDIKKDDYIYVLHDGLYEYTSVEDCVRERGAGCRCAVNTGSVEGAAGVYLSGDHWKTIRYCLAGKWDIDAGGIAWETAGDGESWAFQGAVSGGEKDRFSARYYCNQSRLALPLSDSLRNSVDSYWEGSYAGSWSAASYGVTVRSSHGDESETLTYAYCRVNIRDKGRVTCKYNRYSDASSYYAVKCGGTTAEIPVWFEYTAYDSGYEKYSLGGKLSGKKTGADLYLSYGGVYEWTSRLNASFTWEPGRGIYARCGYSYSDDEPSSHELHISVRVSLY